MDRKFVVLIGSVLAAIVAMLFFIGVSLSKQQGDPLLMPTRPVLTSAKELSLSSEDRIKLTQLLEDFETNAGSYGMEESKLLATDRLIAYTTGGAANRSTVYSPSDFLPMDQQASAIGELLDQYAQVEVPNLDFKYSEPSSVTTAFEPVEFPEEAQLNGGDRWFSVEVPFLTHGLFVHSETNSEVGFVSDIEVEGTLTISFIEREQGWLIYGATDDAGVLLTDDFFGSQDGSVMVDNHQLIKSYIRSTIAPDGSLVDPQDFKARLQ